MFPVSLSTCLPQDRLQAFINDLSIPEPVKRAVLFVDISGFTVLTESLIRLTYKRSRWRFGPRDRMGQGERWKETRD